MVKIMELWMLIGIVLVSGFVKSGEAETKPILINCGANASVDVGGRRWVGDLDTGSNITLSYLGIVATTTNVSAETIYGSLYNTARIFTETSNYTFRVDPGKYYLRLHFYPFSFEDHDVNDSLFTMRANSLKLVSEFSVPAEISRKNSYLESLPTNYSASASLLKEYYLDVASVQLVVEIIPDRGTFAFVNAIELIPVLSKLFADSLTKVGEFGADNSVNLNDRNFETVYRLNVGGSEIKPDQDQDLWRKWESDINYMLTADAGSAIKNASNITYSSANDSSIAPLLVYETARIMTDTQVLEKRINMSWKFEVDPNFDYLVRFHFCELMYNKENQRVFGIFINKKTAAEHFDVFSRAGGMNKAYHHDYVDAVSSQTNTLWIQLGPDAASGASGDALMNGLEIFKLSRRGDLSRISDRSGTGGKKGTGKKVSARALWIGICAGIVSIIVLGILCTIFCYCDRREKLAPNKTRPPGWRPFSLHGIVGTSTTNAQGRSKFPGGYNGGSMATTRTGKYFTLEELRLATNNFDESFVIGVGGFGKVYKGEINDGSLAAIKRAHPQSQQGLKEFETEIEMLSKLRHRHLVSMIGFCEEKNEMILVYEYMAHGTLRTHLFGSDLPPLTWKQRLDACIGAARGLHYLHTGAERGIIHRDVKTTNILLDENFVAKMADFGLSKTGPALDHTHVSTAVKGSFGYLDPEYFRRQQLTEKSDVYSFGVVLFEVVCARPVINPSLPKDQINLAEWAMKWQRRGSLETIVDPHLKGCYSPESMKKFGEIAEKCLADEGKNRPTMGEVLWHLEYVLQLHEASLQQVHDGEESFSNSEIPILLDYQEVGGDMNSEDDEENTRKSMSNDTVGVEEFSQLVKPQGR